jgi:hypothetical protein
MTSGRRRIFDVSLSLTERCGHGCRHCSTEALLGRRKAGVPFPALEKALADMAPSVRVLSISCEGDPFFYGPNGPVDSSRRGGKTIVDAIALARDRGIEDLGIQFYPPRPDKFPLLESILRLSQEAREKGKPARILPLISFHLFGAANGLVRRVRAEGGKRRVELHARGVRDEGAEDWYARIVSRLPLSGRKPGPGGRMAAFLDDAYRAILALASNGAPLHFEVRGDEGPFTGIEIADAVLDMLLEKIGRDHPGISLPRCPDCGRVDLSRKSGHILPLGRAADLFFDGRRLEARLYEDHIRRRFHEPLCPQWTSWGEMTIDTRGYPQLCYSNIALTPGCRTTRGPNLYKDGFAAIRDFYERVWEDRRAFMATHGQRLAREPHDMYCPLPRFQALLSGPRNP